MNDFWQQVKDGFALVFSFLEQAKGAPREIWLGSAEAPGIRIFLILVLIGVAYGLIALIVNFFKSSWRQRLHIVLVTLAALLVLGVVLWYALYDAQKNLETETGSAQPITAVADPVSACRESTVGLPTRFNALHILLTQNTSLRSAPAAPGQI